MRLRQGVRHKRSQADPGQGDGRRLRRPSCRYRHELRRPAALRVRFRSRNRGRRGDRTGGEGVEHRGYECCHVLRSSARGEVPLAHDLLVQPRRPGVHHVVPDPRPRRHGAALQDPGRCEHPRPMAQRDHRLAALDGLVDQSAGRRGLAKQVRVDETSWHDQAVVVAGADLLDSSVNAHPGCRHVQVQATDPSSPQRDQVDLRARRPQGAQRNGQLDLLESVGGQDRDPAALEGVRLLDVLASCAWALRVPPSGISHRLLPRPRPSSARSREPSFRAEPRAELQPQAVGRRADRRSRLG